MVDTMDQEVEGVESSSLGYVVHPVIFSVEEESVQHVLHEGPIKESGKYNGNVKDCAQFGLGSFTSQPIKWERVGKRDTPPRRHRQELKSVVVEKDDVTNGIR